MNDILRHSWDFDFFMVDSYSQMTPGDDYYVPLHGLANRSRKAVTGHGDRVLTKEDNVSYWLIRKRYHNEYYCFPAPHDQRLAFQVQHNEAETRQAIAYLADGGPRAAHEFEPVSVTDHELDGILDLYERRAGVVWVARVIGDYSEGIPAELTPVVKFRQTLTKEVR